MSNVSPPDLTGYLVFRIDQIPSISSDVIKNAESDVIELSTVQIPVQGGAAAVISSDSTNGSVNMESSHSVSRMITSNTKVEALSRMIYHYQHQLLRL